MELGWGLSKILVVPLYITACLAFILTIFKRIEYGIFFLLPFVPHQNILNYLNELPLGKDVNDLLLIAMIIRWYIDKRKAGESFLIKSSLNLPLILFIVWSYIGVWWGANYFGDPSPLSLADPRVMYWKNLIRIPLLFLIVVNNVKNPRQMKIIVLLMIIAILMLDRSFYNITQYRDLSHYSDTQKAGGMESLGGNELAVCLAMYAIVFVTLFSTLRNVWVKALFIGPIWLTYYCIAFLFSRSGYLAAFAGWMVVGILKDKKVLIFLVAIILFWQVLLPTAVRQRIAMTKTEDGYDATTRQRFGMWKFGQEIIASSPIFGAGINAVYSLNITADEFSGQVWHSFHNAYVQQAVETGLVGLGIYLWIFILMIKAGWHLYRIGQDSFQKAIGLGLIACVVSCMAGNVAGGYWNYFSVVGYMYVLAALVVRTIINIEQEKISALKNQDNSASLEKSDWITTEVDAEYAEYFKEKYSHH